SDSSISAGRRQCQSIRAEGDAGDFTAMPAERARLSAGGRVPERDRAVAGRRSDVLSILAERHARQPACVAAQGELFAVTQSPEVIPLEAAQVFLCEVRVCIEVEQFEHAADASFVPGALRVIHT